MLALLMLTLSLDPRAALEAGDAAWRAGDRGAAREAWRGAAAAEDPAIAAMAEVRLLRVSGNLGWMVHGPRADRALAACPSSNPWCDLAEADYDLTLRDLGLQRGPGQAEALARRAAAALPEEAAERLSWLEAPQARWPRGPGTWTLGVGLIGGPGIGLGGSLRLIHPDLGWRRLRLEASGLATSRGNAGLSLALRTPGSPFGSSGLAASTGVVDLYDGEAVQTLALQQLTAWSALGLREGGAAIWLGPQLRLDEGGALLAGHGLLGGARWDRRDGAGSARAGLELALADYALLRGSLDLRARLPLGAHALAGRLYAEGVPLRDELTPAWRLPAAGGAEWLRGAPAGRYRGPWMAAGALELRAYADATLGAVGFAELAWVPTEEDPRPHPGAGLGLRARLPPRPDNTVRLDLGFTDAGWGLVAGWGESF